MINILLVSNSSVDKTLLATALNKIPSLNVIKTLNNEISELSKEVGKVTPDVILVLQKNSSPCNKEGIFFLRQHFKAPIIVCTSDKDDFLTLNNLIILPKVEIQPLSKEFGFWLNELTAIIKKFTQNQTILSSGLLENTIPNSGQKSNVIKSQKKADIIAIGASTGGPQTLNGFLSLLPENLGVPVVIVQHMPANFLSVLIGWLQNDCPLPIEIAQQGERPQAGHVYFAPDHYHLVLDEHKRFKLIDAPPMHNVKPSVSYLFKSVAEVYGKRAIGILLTGMGKDGAKELALIKEKGGITFAQDKKTSIIFGMPKEAIRLNGALYVLPPNEIAQKLREFV